MCLLPKMGVVVTFPANNAEYGGEAMCIFEKLILVNNKGNENLYFRNYATM